MSKTILKVSDIFRAARESGQHITLVFRTATAVPLEDLLVLVRYDKELR